MTVQKIAYQGEPGANSHIACKIVYPDWQPLACDTFEDALSAIAEGAAGLGMIPIENSIAGRVADIHHLLPSANLHIVGEYFLPIHFQLLGLKGAKLGDIRIGPQPCPCARPMPQNHPHADACRRMSPPIPRGQRGRSPNGAIRRGPRSRRRSPPRSMASTCWRAISRTSRTIRLVSSILSKTPAWAAPLDGPIVTSFVFRVRNVPAALYKALGGFATNGVNMTKLESYMVEGEFTATQFLADVEGHPDEPALARALEELAFFCKEFNIFGVYPAHPYRIESRAFERGS